MTDLEKMIEFLTGKKFEVTWKDARGRIKYTFQLCNNSDNPMIGISPGKKDFKLTPEIIKLYYKQMKR